MIFALGFFYPVMFLLFGVVGSEFELNEWSDDFRPSSSVVFLFCLPRNKGVAYNILVWLFLFVGVGLQACFYFMEAFARKSCPPNVRILLLSSSVDTRLVSLSGHILGQSDSAFDRLSNEFAVDDAPSH